MSEHIQFDPEQYPDVSSLVELYDSLSSDEERRAAFAALAGSYLTSKELATEDELTGLANRRGWNGELERRIATAQRRGTSFGYLYIDLDSFKLINDKLGHEAGDDVLRVAARVLKASARAGSEDFGGRMGGDELGALVETHPDSDLNQLEQAQLVAERLRANVNDEITKELPHVRELGRAHGKPFDLSIGVTVFLPKDTASTIHQRAEFEMYKVKREHHDQQGGSYR